MNAYHLKLNEIYQQLKPWLFNHGLRIILIISASILFYYVMCRIINYTVRLFVVQQAGDNENSEQQREDTLISIFTITARVIIIVTAGMMIGAEFGLKIAPLLASAGVVGLALGFGGQYLIKDVISGLFIIIENQYRIDDYVELAGKSGKVERTTLRMTTLRDLDGNIHHIPHGEVTTVTNYSKSYSRININIGVAYGTDINMVAQLINKVGASLATDPNWQSAIISAPKFLRVDDLGDSAIILKILGDTKPSEQWAVSGEMRLRLYQAFTEQGIDIPFPQRTVHIKHTTAS